MKSLYTILMILLISTSAFSQVAPDKYWVIFTDKDNSPYSIDDPSEFLSQKSIDRRQNQGIDIVENDLPVNPQYIDGVLETGVTILTVSKWFNSVVIYTTDENALDQIELLSYVESVQISSKKNSSGYKDVTSKPFFDNEYISPLNENTTYKSEGSYNYGLAFNQISMLNGDALHDMGYDGNGMTIAVLDAGFLNVNTIVGFDSLWTNGQILGTKDFVSPYDPDIFGSHHHGAMVLSTMGANWPENMVGTAPKADYWLLRSEDGASEYIIEELNWVSAAEFADSVGADIINSSLGYTEYDAPFEDHSHTYQDMDGNTAPATIGADIAVSKGMIVCNSAGNSGNGSWFYIGAPADGHNVFSIGAVDSEGDYASFSSNGPTYDGRVKPNVVAQGQGTTIIEPWSGTVSSGSGTSFSSPVTAGMVACLWQANPSKSNVEIMDAIQQSASKYDQPDNQLGYGIPDYLSANSLLTVIDHKNDSDFKFDVYPNPFSGEISISFDEEGVDLEMIEILDISGRVIFMLNRFENYNSDRINVIGLESHTPGFYFVKLYFDGQSVTRKMVKI